VRFFIAATLVLAGLGPAAADFPEAKARGRLEVLFVPGSPEFVDVDKHAGFDMEILEGFARLHRLAVTWVPVRSWDVLLSTLNDGAGDLAAGGITVTDARQRIVRFSGEVFPSRHIMVTRRPHRVLQVVEELRQERVGTIRGTSIAELVALANVPAANVDDSFASGRLPAALRDGKITATVLGVEDALVARRADSALQLGGFLGPRQGLAFALRNRDFPSFAPLNEYIANLRRTPSWNRLVVKYFGDVALEILREAQKEQASEPRH
jgi:ABC-type amino acid transport substrate-binding protein